MNTVYLFKVLEDNGGGCIYFIDPDEPSGRAFLDECFAEGKECQVVKAVNTGYLYRVLDDNGVGCICFINPNEPSGCAWLDEAVWEIIE